MADNVTNEILGELNGSIFLANAQGETQTRDPAYLLIFDTNVNPGDTPCILNENAIVNDMQNENSHD